MIGIENQFSVFLIVAILCRFYCMVYFAGKTCVSFSYPGWAKNHYVQLNLS